MRRHYVFALLLASVLAFAPLALATAEDDPGILLEEGHIKLTPAKGWVRKAPKVRIIEHEFAAPKAEGDTEDGRLTVMGAGGNVKDNIDRWKGQFQTGEGKPVTDSAKSREVKVAGQTVHLVDITGTYKDAPAGPFAGGKTTLKENYRMLGAIIVTERYGQYFLKFYGPKKTIDAQEKAFLESVNTLEVK